MRRNMRKLLKAFWFTPGIKGRWGLPIMFESKPGIGKTQEIENECGVWGLHCETVIASLREPADFMGLPVPQEDGSLRYMPPSWASRLVKAKRGVGFLDEINTAAPAVQAVLLRPVNEGWVGDLELPKTVRWIGAHNSVEDAAGGWDLAPPMANRFGHLKWDDPEIFAWSDWLLGDQESGLRGAGFDPEAEEERVLQAWGTPFAMARGAVAAFVKARPQLLHKQPEAGNAQASQAWPSPRTWEMAARAMAGAKIHGLDVPSREIMVEAFVGPGPAGELIQWLEKADLPNPEDLLDRKVEFDHDPRRLDRTVAVLSSCAAIVTPEDAKKRDDRASELWRIMNTLKTDAIDVCVPAARAMANHHLTDLKAAEPILKSLNKILTRTILRKEK